MKNPNADLLLERIPPESYLDQWRELLSQKKSGIQQGQTSPVLLFRVYSEWLAIDVSAVRDVVELKPLHTIPHCHNSIVSGIVNVRGQLRFSISLADLLSIEKKEEARAANPLTYQRTLLIGLDEHEWACTVHEVERVHDLDIGEIKKAPVTVAKSKDCYLRGLFLIEGKEYGYLEEELLFYSLKRGPL